jgi:hypothetical protein
MKISRQRKAPAGNRSAPEPGELYDACESVLSPIAAQFLELGFGVGSFLQAGKKAYVNAAIAAIRRSGERPTDSRVAAITGLQRKEIKALSGTHANELPLSAKLPPTTRVLQGWLTDPSFHSKLGSPRALAVEGRDSFKTLVEKYGGDVTHVSIMREFERLELLRRREDGLLQLERRTVQGSHNLRDVENFAARVADYAAALSAGDEATLTKSYVGHRLANLADARLGAALSRTFARRAEEFLDGFERWVARSMGDHSSEHEQGDGVCFSLGIYLVERPPEKKDPRPQRSAPTRRAKRA